MRSKYLLISILMALCAVGLHQLGDATGGQYPLYQVSAGQIADFDLVAPFDFPVLKSTEQLQREFEQKLLATGKPYALDPNVEFEVFNNLNRLFDLLFEGSQSDNWESVKLGAQRLGFQLSDAHRPLSADPEKVNAAYNAIRDGLTDIYRVGIYSNINADSVSVVTDSGLQRNSLTRYYQLEQAKRVLTTRYNGILASLVRDNLNQLIRPNLLVNENLYRELQRDIRTSLNPVAGTVLQNEIIVSRNQRLSEDQINKLDSLTREYQNRGVNRPALDQWLSAMGLLLYFFALVLLFNLYLQLPGRLTEKGKPNLLVLNLSLLALIGLAVLNNRILNLDNSMLPVAMLVLSVSLLTGLEPAIFTTVCGVLLLAPFVNWEIGTVVQLLLSLLLALVAMQKLKAGHSYFKIWLNLFLAQLLVLAVLSLHLFKGDNLGEKITGLLQNAGYTLVASAISVVGCMLIVSHLERKWNRATRQRLLELLDFNHPLLKKLATNAQGTYHHSLIVGNLAERAAEAIGADPLLARVGSYYHDVGKLISPELFTENNEESSELHVHYSPAESADLIRNHVREGVALARKHRLPEAVVDIIDQHHGKSFIRYFLEAAERSGEVTDATAFRYMGPLPQTREAAVVMLADVIESTTKSKINASEDEICQIVDESVQRLIRDGQFDEAPITLADLSLIREVMLPILAGIYRKRLDYPEEKRPD